MLLLKNMKKFIFIIFLFFCIPGVTVSLNIFELFMVKTGVAFVYYQYNDKSLNYENELSKKNKILSNFYQNKVKKITPSNFNNLPLQQQLLIIEELHFQK